MKTLFRASPILLAWLIGGKAGTAEAQTVSSSGRTAAIPYKGASAITLPSVTPGFLRGNSNYIITSYTRSATGELYLRNSTTSLNNITATGSTYSGGTSVPYTPAPQLSFTPAGASALGKTVSFTFVGTDVSLGGDRNYSAPVTFTISFTNANPVAANVSGNRILSSVASTTLSPTLSASDAEDDLTHYTITSLPAANQGVLRKNTAPVVLGTASAQFTAAELSQLNFAPVAGYVGDVNFAYTATDGGGATSSAASYSFRVVTPPVANNVRTGAIPSNADKTAIAALSVTPATGNTIATYNLNGIPGGGKLFLNATEITAARAINPTEAGQLFFAPSGTTSGEFTFTYTATNNDGLESSPATYTIPVANVPPVAVNDPIKTVSRNQEATVAILTNDTDRDGRIEPTTVDLDPSMAGLQKERTIAGQGKFTVDAAGIVTFVPVNNYAGISTVLYTVQDNSGLTSNIATARVEVKNVTTAYDDSNEVEKNTKIFGNVILNDIDPDNTGLTVSLLTNTVHGTLLLRADGSYEYTPTANYLGADQFVYRACDKSGAPQCGTATVYLNVYDPAIQCISATGPNQLVNPSFELGNIGFNTNYEYKEDLPNVNNELVPETTYGIGPDASKYHNNFRGYGRGGSATVNNNFMLINATSAIRTLYTQTFKVEPNRYYTFSAYFNNLLPPGSNGKFPEVGFVINGGSTSGTIVVPETPDEWVQYSDVWYSGNNTTATFEIRNLTLDRGGNDIGIDDLYFGTCNAVPVAYATTTTPLPRNASAAAIKPMEATDPDGSISSFTIRTVPTSGTLFVNGVAAVANRVYTVADNSKLTYSPASGRTGNYTFTFLATDNSGSISNEATYTIPVGDTAPLAQNVTTAPAVPNIAAATPINPMVATDGNGTITKYVIASVPNAAHGTLFVNGTRVTSGPLEVLPSQVNQLSFDPTGTYAGNTTFTYYAIDNDGNVSNTALYTIPISNELPVAQDKFLGGMRNTWGPTPLSPLTATDADGTIVSFTVASLPSTGSLTLNGVSVAVNQTIRPEQASELAYAPSKATTGSFNFTYYATDNLGGVSNLASYTISTSGPLPVELVGFEAKAAGGSAQLNWRTAAELHNDRFEVERSFTGADFTAVGTVKGSGTTSSGASYRFTDANVRAQATGPVYYRLKQVDTDGTVSYSSVRMVAFRSELKAAISVAPNPATTEATLDLTSLPLGQYQVAVVDAAGRTIYSAAHTGGQTATLNLSTWPSGVYVVIVRGEAGKFTQRIAKQ